MIYKYMSIYQIEHLLSFGKCQSARDSFQHIWQLRIISPLSSLLVVQYLVAGVPHSLEALTSFPNAALTKSGMQRLGSLTSS